MPEKDKSGKDLRRRAEDMLLKQPAELDKIPPADLQRVLHELKVHQIELEMQNDELSRIQLDLQASRQKYFDLYDLAPVGYVTLNENGIIIVANLTTAALLGKERRDVLGQPLSSFIFRENQDIYYRCHKQLIETQQRQECNVKMLKGDGTQLWVRVESIAARGNEKEVTFLTAIIDITAIKQAEEELARYREHLEDLVKERTVELTIANEHLDAFNYSVSHDLRAPLRHILGFFELLQKRNEAHQDEKSRGYALSIFAAVNNMESLIDAMLSFANIGRGIIQMREVTLSKLLHEAVLEVLNETPDQTNKRDIIWKIGDLPDVYCEPALLKLALVNLISNAVKFTSKRVRAEIWIGYKEAKDEFIFSVKDNGAGFNMDYADRLFIPFQRLHRQSDFEGTGIGLANVHRIIALHSGRIRAEGAEGQGATFFFTLPKREH